MVGPGEASRGAQGAVRTGSRAIRIVNQRNWLKYLRNETLLRAINIQGIPPDQRLQEIVDTLGEVLDATEIQFESQASLTSKLKRRWRESVSHGIRYPTYEGASRQTFWERLYAWARDSAETPKGREALQRARFHDQPNQSDIFAARVVSATYQVLLESFHQKGPDRFRLAMADELNYGLTEQQRAERRRRLQVIVRAISSGGAGTTVSLLGFHNDWLESLGLGVVALTVTGVVDLSHGGLDRLTSSMKAARKQALLWLRTLSYLLTPFIYDIADPLRDSPPGEVENLIRVLAAMTSGDLLLEELPGTDELLRGLDHIQNTADRVRDDELAAALIDVETALKYELRMLPEAVGRLLNLVQAVEEEHGHSATRYGIPTRRTQEIGREDPDLPSLDPPVA